MTIGANSLFFSELQFIFQQIHFGIQETVLYISRVTARLIKRLVSRENLMKGDEDCHSAHGSRAGLHQKDRIYPKTQRLVRI